jgi:polar amino acid transport system ATP-binding protein
MMNSDWLIRSTALSKDFGRGPVLRGVDLSIAHGERVAIVGPSGSGKTTLLRCLNLLTLPDSGRLEYQGELVAEWQQELRARHPRGVHQYRSKIGMVFQRFELFPHLSARENVCLGPRKVLGVSRQEAESRADAVLERIGLAQFAAAKPRTLSGGQQQRVAIARALAMEPELILFDEPTSALDPAMAAEVLEVMRDLATEGRTMVIVTHELNFARSVADRLVIMDDGAIIDQGPPDQLFSAGAGTRTEEILRYRYG